jgi:sulfide:quinone oxidoreductase
VRSPDAEAARPPDAPRMAGERTKVTIVGGGVAALEALIALRGLAQERVDLELVTPDADWAYRPLAIAEPFGLGEARSYDLVRIAGDHGAALHLAGVRSVDPHRHRLTTWDGRMLDYGILLVAVGARPTTSVPGSVTIQGPGFTSRFRTILREIDERRIRQVVFAVPVGTSWPLPLYELAFMTAAHASERGLDQLRLSVVTPEQEPLEMFGPAASSAIRRLLEERAIEFHGSQTPVQARNGRLRLIPTSSMDAERVVSLPRLSGPSLPGLPHDAEGYIPTDDHGLVSGELDVYAAGDATTCPLKQGGVATQQADAAAEAIAARAGAQVEAKPFKPVLRGLLLTGGEPQFLRAEQGGTADPSTASTQALWWPPSKVAGRWLAPYLALRHDEIESPPAGLEVEVHGEPSGVRRRAVIGRDGRGRAAVSPIRRPEGR